MKTSEQTRAGIPARSRCEVACVGTCRRRSHADSGVASAAFLSASRHAASAATAPRVRRERRGQLALEAAGLPTAARPERGGDARAGGRDERGRAREHERAAAAAAAAERGREQQRRRGGGGRARRRPARRARSRAPWRTRPRSRPRPRRGGTRAARAARRRARRSARAARRRARRASSAASPLARRSASRAPSCSAPTRSACLSTPAESSCVIAARARVRGAERGEHARTGEEVHARARAPWSAQRLGAQQLDGLELGAARRRACRSTCWRRARRCRRRAPRRARSRAGRASGSPRARRRRPRARGRAPPRRDRDVRARARSFTRASSSASSAGASASRLRSRNEAAASPGSAPSAPSASALGARCARVRLGAEHLGRDRRDEVLRGVLRHVVPAPRPVERERDLRARREARGRGVRVAAGAEPVGGDGDAVRGDAVDVRDRAHGEPGERAAVARLPAALGEEDRVLEHDVELARRRPAAAAALLLERGARCAAERPRARTRRRVCSATECCPPGCWQRNEPHGVAVKALIAPCSAARTVTDRASVEDLDVHKISQDRKAGSVGIVGLRKHSGGWRVKVLLCDCRGIAPH